MSAASATPKTVTEPRVIPAWASGQVRNSTDTNEQALLDLLAGRLPGAEIPDVETLLALVQYHRIHSSVLETLRSKGPVIARWAEVLETRLLETRLLETHAWRQKDVEGSRIANAFAKRGIEGLFVKGFALAKHVYQSPADRAFGDIDVWVAPEEWPKAAQALAILGYKSRPIPHWTEAIGMAFLKDATDEQGTLEIDLHWRFVGRQGPQRFTNVDMAAIRARGSLPEPGMRLATVEDEIILAACHLVRSSFCPLSAFVDLKQLVARTPNWKTVWCEAAGCGLRTALRAGLELSSALLAYELPEGAVPIYPWSLWQRSLLLPFLAPAKLVRHNRMHMFGARFSLKYFCQDSIAQVLATLLCLPLDIVGKLLRRAQAYHP